MRKVYILSILCINKYKHYMFTAAYSHYASYYSISNKCVETVEFHTASCHLEINQLGV